MVQTNLRLEATLYGQTACSQRAANGACERVIPLAVGYVPQRPTNDDADSFTTASAMVNDASHLAIWGGSLQTPSVLRTKSFGAKDRRLYE